MGPDRAQQNRTGGSLPIALHYILTHFGKEMRQRLERKQTVWDFRIWSHRVTASSSLVLTAISILRVSRPMFKPRTSMASRIYRGRPRLWPYPPNRESHSPHSQPVRKRQLLSDPPVILLSAILMTVIIRTDSAPYGSGPLMLLRTAPNTRHIPTTLIYDYGL